jgi:hypothetical protein
MKMNTKKKKPRHLGLNIAPLSRLEKINTRVIHHFHCVFPSLLDLWISLSGFNQLINHL